MNESKNKVVAFILYPEIGGYFPTFKLAKELKKRGFEVIYFCTVEFTDEVAKQGLNYEVMFEKQFGKGTFDADPIHPDTGFIERYKRVQSLHIHKVNVLYDELISGRLVKKLKSRRVSLLFVDSSLGNTVGVVAHLGGIKVFSIATYLFGVDCYNTPTSSYLICDQSSVFLSFRIYLIWTKAKVYRLILSMLLPISNWILKIPRFDSQLITAFDAMVNKAKEEGGITFVSSEFGDRPPFPELVLCNSEFDFTRRSNNDSRQYIGHCIDLDRKEPSFPWQQVDRNKSIIYCSLGTHVADYTIADDFFTQILIVAKKRPQFHFIISMGPARKLEDFGEIPDNVTAQRKIPQLEVLKKAKIMITNGGLGTLKECIYFGVPILVIPCKFDQPGNSARVCAHGIGLRYVARKIKYKRLIALIDRLTNELSFKHNIQNMSVLFRTEHSFNEAIKFIERS